MSDRQFSSPFTLSPAMSGARCTSSWPDSIESAFSDARSAWSSISNEQLDSRLTACCLSLLRRAEAEKERELEGGADAGIAFARGSALPSTLRGAGVE